MPTTREGIAGRELRYRLTMLLREAHRPLTVRELLETLDQADHAVAGRPSKTVSDALRWEIRRGRVVRVGRSTYAIARIPPSTLRWIRRWLDERTRLTASVGHVSSSDHVQRCRRAGCRVGLGDC